MPSSELTVETLLSMTPLVGGVDVVSKAARALFLSHVKSQPCVHDVFFPNHQKDELQNKIEKNWFDFDKFACLYVSHAITQIKDPFKIYSMLNEQKIDDKLAELYSSPYWKKIGFALYTLLFADIVKDSRTSISFRAYMNDDRQYWAGKVLDKVKDSQWIYSVVHPIVKGQCTDVEYNRDMNYLFVKLHILDPPSVFPAYNYIRKALPDLNLELATTNYLGKPLEWELIKPDLEEVIRRATYPNNSSRFRFDSVETYHGVEVIEFVMQDAKYMGLWSGKHADNKRVSGVTERCSIM